MEILFLILGGPRKFSKCKFLEVEYKYKLITSWEIHFWKKTVAAVLNTAWDRSRTE